MDELDYAGGLQDYAGRRRPLQDTPEDCTEHEVERAMATIQELRKYIDTSGPKPNREMK